MLTANHRREALSRVYIHAVASKCGMNCSFGREFDYGIDVTLHEIKQREGRYVESGFKLDIQAKSSTNIIFENTIVKYDMETKTYEDLRDPDVGTPRILVLLALPEAEDDWSCFSEESLIIQKCAYWMSLRDWPPCVNDTRIRVNIPRANCFNSGSLLGMMERIRAGGDP